MGIKGHCVDVVVDRIRLDRGDLPRICAVTGRPAIGTSEVRYSSMPSWGYLLGALPILWMTQDLTAFVPVAEGVVERVAVQRRRMQWVTAALAIVLVFGVIALVAAVAGGGADVEGVAAAVGPAVVGIGLLTGFVINRRVHFVDLRPVRGFDQVRIIGAHPDFVAAVEAERAVDPAARAASA